MFLVATRNFPPEVGGMQNLMEGLSNALLNHGPVKVFAENFDNAEEYDQNSKLEIEQKISETEFSEVNPKLLSEILKNLSQILPDLPLLTRKAVLSQVIAQIMVFNKKIEVRVGEKIYNINFKKIASTNKKFVEATIERDGRESNPQRPA